MKTKGKPPNKITAIESPSFSMMFRISSVLIISSPWIQNIKLNFISFTFNVTQRFSNFFIVSTKANQIQSPPLRLLPLRGKCSHLEFFWSRFSRIWNEYREILPISTYSVRMWENTDQYNSEYGRFLCSLDCHKMWGKKEKSLSFKKNCSEDVTHLNVLCKMYTLWRKLQRFC